MDNTKPKEIQYIGITICRNEDCKKVDSKLWEMEDGRRICTDCKRKEDENVHKKSSNLSNQGLVTRTLVTYVKVLRGTSGAKPVFEEARNELFKRLEANE